MSKFFAVMMAVMLGAQFVGAADKDNEGFTILFGKDLADGWHQAGPGGFKVADGEMTAHGGMGLFWHEKELGDFTLKLEFKQKNVNHNSGVFVRFPDPKNDPWIAVRQGYEIQIAGDKPGKNSTGAIYDIQGAKEVTLKPAGEWNDYEITVIGQKYTITLNGKVINEYTGDGSRGVRGRIGIQNHDNGAPVSFRNIRVKELK